MGPLTFGLVGALVQTKDLLDGRMAEVKVLARVVILGLSLGQEELSQMEKALNTAWLF